MVNFVRLPFLVLLQVWSDPSSENFQRICECVRSGEEEEALLVGGGGGGGKKEKNGNMIRFD